MYHTRRSRALATAGLIPVAVLLAGLASTPAQADVTSSKAIQTANIQPNVAKNSKGQVYVQQLDSGGSKAVYCDLKETGFNGVVMTWPLFQHTRDSTVITSRAQGKDRSPTPTSEQLQRAVKNAQDCGLTYIAWKPHLEVDDNSWRGRIGTRTNSKGKVIGGWSNKQADAWTRSYRGWINDYATQAKSLGVSELTIGTEQWGSTLTKFGSVKLNKYNAKRWAETAKQAKKRGGKKVKISYAAHTSYELRGLPKTFAKSRYLDLLEFTWYPRVLTADTSVKALQAEMMKDKKKYFDYALKKYKKPMMCAEIGFASVKADKQYLKRGSLTSADVDEQLQSRRYQAALNVLDKTKVKGVSLYRVDNDPMSGGPKDPWLTWQRKEAEKVIARTFKGRVPVRR